MQLFSRYFHWVFLKHVFLTQNSLLSCNVKHFSLYNYKKKACKTCTSINITSIKMKLQELLSINFLKILPSLERHTIINECKCVTTAYFPKCHNFLYNMQYSVYDYRDLTCGKLNSELFKITFTGSHFTRDGLLKYLKHQNNIALPVV